MIRRSHGSVAATGLLLGGLLGLLAGCGPAGDERLARTRLANVPGPWQSESTVPEKPQARPDMVIWEVSRYGDGVAPSAEQELAAQQLIDASFASAEKNRWFDYDVGLADGFEKMTLDQLHYVNREFLYDDRILDPERPEFLIYYAQPEGRQLAGYMYYVRSPEEQGPQVGGPLTIWHYHVWSEPRCLEKQMIVVGKPYLDGPCARGAAAHRSPEMVHVWLVDHPDGPFATKMGIDTRVLPTLLEKRRSERGW